MNKIMIFVMLLVTVSVVSAIEAPLEYSSESVASPFADEDETLLIVEGTYDQLKLNELFYVIDHDKFYNNSWIDLDLQNQNTISVLKTVNDGWHYLGNIQIDLGPGAGYRIDDVFTEFTQPSITFDGVWIYVPNAGASTGADLENTWYYGPLSYFGFDKVAYANAPDLSAGTYPYHESTVNFDFSASTLSTGVWAYRAESNKWWYVSSDQPFRLGSQAYSDDGVTLRSIAGQDIVLDGMWFETGVTPPEFTFTLKDVKASEMSIDEPLEATVLAQADEYFKEVRFDVIRDDRVVYTHFAPEEDLDSNTVELDVKWYTPLVLVGSQIVTYTLIEQTDDYVQLSIAGDLEGYVDLVYLGLRIDLRTENIALTGATSESGVEINVQDMGGLSFTPEFYAADGINSPSTGTPVIVTEDFIGIEVLEGTNYQLHARAIVDSDDFKEVEYTESMEVFYLDLEMDLLNGEYCEYTRQCDDVNAICMVATGDSFATCVDQTIRTETATSVGAQTIATDVTQGDRAVYVEPDLGHGGYKVWVKDTLGKEQSLQDAIRNKTVSALGGSVCGYNTCVNTVDSVFDIAGDCTQTSEVMAIGSCSSQNCEAFSCGKGCTAFKTCWQCAFTFGAEGFTDLGTGSQELSEIRNQLSCPQWPYKSRMVPTDSGFICEVTGETDASDEPETLATGKCNREEVVLSCGKGCVTSYVQSRCYFTSGETQDTGWVRNKEISDMANIMTCPNWPYQSVFELRESGKFICKKDGTTPPSPRDEPKIAFDVTKPTFGSSVFAPPGQAKKLIRSQFFAGYDTTGDGINDSWASIGTTINMWDDTTLYAGSPRGYPNAWDTNGDREPDSWDLSGNKRTDAWDTSGNGRIDAWDSNNDGLIDIWDLLDNDGVADAWDTLTYAEYLNGFADTWDTNGDGSINAWDTSGDNSADAWDTTEYLGSLDGVADAWDTIGDGRADAWDTNGDRQADAWNYDSDSFIDSWDTTGDGRANVFDEDNDGLPDE